MVNNPMEKIFEIENDSRILSFKTYDDIPIYLIAKRYLLFEILMPQYMDLTISRNDRRINIDAIKFLILSIVTNLKNRELCSDKEIVFYTVNRPTIIDGKYVNRYTDFFANLFKNQSITIEQTPMDWSWPFPRHNTNVIMDGFAIASASIISKFTYKKDLKEVKKFLEFFTKQTAAICGYRIDDEKQNEIAVHISKDIAVMRYRTKWIEKTIPKSTKIMIMIGGSYPSYYPINRMLKRRGIITADIQHGFIGKTNPVYTYAEKIRNSPEVILGSANYFLTYGEWWNSQIMNPSKKIAVGNPYRDHCLSKIEHNNSAIRKVLVIGCGVNTEKYIDLSLHLRKELGGFEVAFRPHPGELLETKRLLKENSIDLRIDFEKEIYNSLEEAYVVISEASTVLFEAIGISKHIIVWDTDYSKANLPNHPFAKSNSVNGIIEMIRNNKYDDGTIRADDIWAKDYIKRFESFITGSLSGME